MFDKGLLRNRIDNQLQEHFRQFSEVIVKAGAELDRMFLELPNAEATCSKLDELEHRGDDLERTIHELLDRAFITSWLDRSDATNLADAMDYCLDSMRGTARFIGIFQIQSAIPDARALTGLIIQAAEQIKLMINDLIKKKFTQIAKSHAKIANLEQQADELRYRAMKNLWQEAQKQSSQNFLLTIAWKEIIEELELVTDHTHHVAQICLSIARKA